MDVFDYDNYGSKPKAPEAEKKGSGKVGFLKSLNQQKAADDDMDCILDDPDNLENFDDY